MNIKYIIKYNATIFMYNMLHKILPQHVQDLCTIIENIPREECRIINCRMSKDEAY